MKLTIKTESLRKALTLAAAMPGGAITDEQIIRFQAEKGKLTATRLNQTSLIHAYAESKTKKGGAVNVDSKTMGEMLKEITSEEIELEAKGDILFLTAGKAVGKFKTVPDEVLTKAPAEDKSARDLIFKAGQLKTLLEVVTPAMGTEAQKRPFAQGVTVQNLGDGKGVQFISSDSRRFHLAESGLDEEIHELIPDSVCNALLKILAALEAQADVMLGFNENAVFFNGATCEFRSAKAEVTPFDYTKFRPMIESQSDSEITINKAALISAVKLATPFGFNVSKVIGLNIRKGELEIEANTEKGAECNQSVEGKGKNESQTRISAPYFMQALSACNGSEKVTLRHLAQPEAICIKDDDRFLLVMAIRDARAAEAKAEAPAETAE